MGSKCEVKYFSKFNLKKNFIKFQIWKKIFFWIFSKEFTAEKFLKNPTKPNFGKIFNFFTKVYDNTKTYENDIVIQYPSQ